MCYAALRSVFGSYSRIEHENPGKPRAVQKREDEEQQETVACPIRP
jgi:hypothetical protein